MIIEIYILIQFLILILLYLGWTENHPMFWILSFVFSAIQIFTSYSIDYVVMVLNSSGELTGNIINFSFPILSYINILFLMISLLMFFWDIFNPKESLQR